MPKASVDGVTVHYEERGDASQHAVVLSHGFLMDHSMFDPQVQVLARDFRCVTWDQRGHSETPATAPFGYWDSARDLLGLLDHLGIDEAALVGMSQGGFVSLRAALLAPARVRGLAFIDSQAGVEAESARPGYDALFEQWTSEGVSDTIAGIVATAILGDVDAAPWVERWRSMDPDAVRHAYGALMSRDDLHDRLAEVSCPALVIHGTADAAIPMASARRLCDGLPGCRRLVEIEGGGHASNLSHPEEVTAALAGFLGALWPRQGVGGYPK